MSTRRRNNITINSSDVISHAFLALAMMAFVFYLFYFQPTLFARFVAEDQWCEYGTSVSFALGGIIFLSLLFGRGLRSQKVMWGLIGIIAIFIAGEEISWGQRIFSIAVPEPILQFNNQGELTLHNMSQLSSIKFHHIMSLLVVIWCILSGIVSLWFPVIKDKIEKIGLPVIPNHLIPMFLLMPYFFRFAPIFKNDEISELFLGIAVAALSFDQFLRYGRFKLPRGVPVMGLLIGILFTMLISIILTSVYPFPLNLRWRLNKSAVLEYPSFKMYDQAEQIYEYIYAHPEYLRSDTRINHGKMLLKLGRRTDASVVLSQAAELLESGDSQGAQVSENLRHLGLIYKFRGQSDRADAKFNIAMEVIQQQLKSVSNSNEEAELLWQIAEISADRGEISAAIEQAKEAKSKATSPVLRTEIMKWIRILKNTGESALRVDL